MTSAVLPAGPVSAWLPSQDLPSLDLLLCVGSSTRAAELLPGNPASVRRRAARCAHFLGLDLERSEAGWRLLGESPFLPRERHLQQCYRLSGFAPLRLDLDLAASGLVPHLPCPDWPPPGWICHGSPDRAATGAHHRLRQRLTDALLALRGVGVAHPPDPAWSVTSLAQLPLCLLGRSDQMHFRQGGVRGSICLVPSAIDASPLLPTLRAMGLQVRPLPGDPEERALQSKDDLGELRLGTALDLSIQPSVAAPPWVVVQLLPAAEVELVLVHLADAAIPDGTWSQPLHQLQDALRQRIAAVQALAGPSLIRLS